MSELGLEGLINFCFNPFNPNNPTNPSSDGMVSIQPLQEDCVRRGGFTFVLTKLIHKIKTLHKEAQFYVYCILY
jgi:hypothetical protein